MKNHTLFSCFSMCALAVLLSCSAPATPAEQAATELKNRLVPSLSVSFRQVPDSVESYRFYSEGRKLVIEGTGALSMAVGLNRYLNEYCDVTVSWDADHPLELPRKMPRVETPVSARALLPDRFFLNYCTFGYTMPWWGWREWEHFIDWMALQGINLPLAITGQEACWQEVWRRHGLTDDEIRAWFTGPAHLPWHRMCNIDGVDGPLPQGWIDRQEALQKQILSRERELEMRPVLPAFAGHVPGELKSLYPAAAITDITHWGGFPKENMPHFLAPTDTLYARIQREFLEAQTRRYGTDHIYGFDLFNEVDAPSWDPETLAAIGREAYASVSAVDPEARWLQMGWMFYYDRRHWTPENVKAYLQAVPQGKVVILDYFTENTPVWPLTESFFGQPYIFCFLGNFGGNTQLVGPFRGESARLQECLENGGANLRGLGCTLEGFSLNQWMYEYVLGRAWDTGVADDDWLRILDRRHHSPEGLWQHLADSVYSKGEYSDAGIICGRPRLERRRFTPDSDPKAKVNARLVQAWKRLLDHPADNGSWRRDAVMLGAQALCNRFALLRDVFAGAYRSGDRTTAGRLAGEMRALMADVAALAACDPQFRLDRWLNAAESFADTPEEKAYYRHNAWLLITIWGAEAEPLNDYASRLWAGLVEAYYAPRWNLFLDTVLGSMETGTPYDEEAFNRACRALEECLAAQAAPVQDPPAGDVRELCQKAYEKYFDREINVLSYNVGVFSKYSQDSLPEVAELIGHSGASLVALNELDSCNRRHNEYQLARLAEELGGWDYHFASAFPFAGGAYGNGVVSREPILSRHFLPLPQADGSEPRSVAVVETERCVFASVHLDYMGEEAQQVQAGVINDWFQAHYAGYTKPVLLCGDFNASPDSPVLGLLEPCWQRLSGTSPTHSTDNPSVCIDYILAFKGAAPVSALSEEVLTEGTEQLSDHFPVRVHLIY